MRAFLCLHALRKPWMPSWLKMHDSTSTSAPAHNNEISISSNNTKQNEERNKNCSLCGIEMNTRAIASHCAAFNAWPNGENVSCSDSDRRRERKPPDVIVIDHIFPLPLTWTDFDAINYWSVKFVLNRYRKYHNTNKHSRTFLAYSPLDHIFSKQFSNAKCQSMELIY